MTQIKKEHYEILCKNYVYTTVGGRKVYLGEMLLEINNNDKYGVIYRNGDFQDNRKSNLEMIELIS